MARQYRYEIQRPGVTAELYVHDDNSLELTDPDSGLDIEYLRVKLAILKELIAWMRMYGVTNIECTWEG